jgi:hypothetical protein
VLSQLGTGSTSKALLVSTDGGDYANRVFKVALNDAAARRLEREAHALRAWTPPRPNAGAGRRIRTPGRVRTSKLA